MSDPDARKTLGYVVTYPNGELASPIVFGTKLRAMNFMESLPPQNNIVTKVRSESEREAHLWGEPKTKK